MWIKKILLLLVDYFTYNMGKGSLTCKDFNQAKFKIKKYVYLLQLLKHLKCCANKNHNLNLK